MTSTTGNGSKARWVGIGLTAGIAVLALTVQWGVVTTRLETVGTRLSELTTEIRSLRTDLVSIERRVSYIEGRLNGRPLDSAGGEP